MARGWGSREKRGLRSRECWGLIGIAEAGVVVRGNARPASLRDLSFWLSQEPTPPRRAAERDGGFLYPSTCSQQRFSMSIDRSLKSSGGMSKKRSVYTRAERIQRLIDDKKMDVNKNGKALGLAKTRVGKA